MENFYEKSLGFNKMNLCNAVKSYGFNCINSQGHFDISKVSDLKITIKNILFLYSRGT